MDPVSVDTFLSALRALTASKFVTTGFSNSPIDLAVTSNESKRTEKVQISPSGNDYIAKREDGPLLYQIDTKTIEDMRKAADGLKPFVQPPAAK